MDNLKQKAFRGLTWNLLDKVINQAGSFVLLIYLSRVLTPSDFGLVAMLAIFLLVAQSLIDSGFSQALIQKSGNVTEVDFSTVFYLNLTVSGFLYCSLYFSAPSIAIFYDSAELVDLSRVLFTVVIINSLALVPRAKLTISLDFKTQSLINSVATIVSAGLAIYMVNDGYGYWSLVGMTISRSSVIAILLIGCSSWHPRWLFSLKSCKTLFSFGSNLLVAGVIATAVQNLYSVLIARYFNAAQLGFFYQSFQYTNMLSHTLTSAIQGVTFPVMSSVQRDKRRLVSIYTRVMGVVVLITFPTFVGFSAISEEFVLIFLGSQWIPMIPVLFILALARTFTPINALNLNILNARGRSDLFLKADLIKLPVSLAGLLIAIPYGIVAVAISQLIFVVVSFFINTYYPGKLFGFGARKQLKQIFPVALASGFMYICIELVQAEILIMQLIIKIVVGMFSYCLACWILRVPSFIHLRDIILRQLKLRTSP